MQRPKNASATFPRAPQDVVHAALGVIEHGDYRLFALSVEHGRILFSTTQTLMSYERELVAEVRPTDAGSTVDLVCGMVDGKQAALLDGRKNAKFAQTFLAALTAALDSGAPRPTAPVESFWTLDDGARAPWNGTDLPQVWPGRKG